MPTVPEDAQAAAVAENPQEPTDEEAERGRMTDAELDKIKKEVIPMHRR